MGSEQGPMEPSPDIGTFFSARWLVREHAASSPDHTLPRGLLGRFAFRRPLHLSANPASAWLGRAWDHLLIAHRDEFLPKRRNYDLAFPVEVRSDFQHRAELMK